MRLPVARGPLSAALVASLSGERRGPVDEIVVERALTTADPLADDDLHLSLWTMYELHYRGFDEVDPAREWDPEVLAVRRRLEAVFEQAVRDLAGPVVEDALTACDDIADQIEHVIASVDGPDLARHVQREATREQVLDLLAQRSLYTLKEADPTSFTIPRLGGGAKAALVELQYDEYGGGRPDRMHAKLYADGLAACGLDASYGAYLDQVPAHVLVTNNVVSLFGLHRRLRGASLGHLASFEATSSLPCRRFAAGIDRLGLAREMWEYFDEHVEADAVHEQVALRDICGRLVADEPALRVDVLMGAAACQQLESRSGALTLQAWRQGRSSLLHAEERVSA